MLSGVVEDGDVNALVSRFSAGQLVRMMSLIQQTAAGFTRNTSRRLDVELLIVNLCTPELSLDAEAMNSRLTKLEEQIRGGMVQITAAPVAAVASVEPAPVKEAIPEVVAEEPVKPQPAAPAGFWTDVVAELRSELPASVAGFFATTPNAPVLGIMNGDRLELRCQNNFTAGMINKPEITQVIERKVSGKLGKRTAVFVTDGTAPKKSEEIQQLLKFGDAYSDIVKIKE